MKISLLSLQFKTEIFKYEIYEKIFVLIILKTKIYLNILKNK